MTFYSAKPILAGVLLLSGLAGCASTDRAAGTNVSGTNPAASDGTRVNPSGTAVERAADRAAGFGRRKSDLDDAPPPRDRPDFSRPAPGGADFARPVAEPHTAAIPGLRPDRKPGVPTTSAPAASASAAFSPVAKTATRGDLPVPCGRLTVPRTIWSALRGSTPRRMAASTVASKPPPVVSFARRTASSGE